MNQTPSAASGNKRQAQLVPPPSPLIYHPHATVLCPMKTLVPILGDQLSLNLSSLRAVNKKDTIVLMTECMDEATYIRHHKKKLVLVFSCMRHFAELLTSKGWQVDYLTLDTPKAPRSIDQSITTAIKRHKCERIVITEAAEYRLQQSLLALQNKVNAEMQILEDTRFMCPHDRFTDWASGRKQLRMENFYREMRLSTGLLMNGKKPEGDQWNFDKDNRKPANDTVSFHAPLAHKPDNITEACIALVNKKFGKHIGHTDNFWFATTSKDAQKSLKHFIKKSLPTFGDYQDAMLNSERFLSHSVLAIYINIGLLDPMDVCQQVEKAYRDGSVPINAAEGFIRQIIGWREYVRGIYWLKMPEYVDENFFGHQRKLPDFYWTAKTPMACMSRSIEQTIDESYAHHIQRLMVTGNFAMLIGVDPKEVHEWYLAVYADAYEWVELPNTLGMSQFADGGLLGSKPYAAGGNYINKMSDYCKQCQYKVSKKAGDQACPFNYLYWHFLNDNKDKLKNNHRLAQVYRTWDRMSDERKAEIAEDSEKFLASLK